MPLFEYECRACHESFETLVTSRTTDAVRCPKCESADVGRLLELPTAKVTEGGAATNCRGDGPPCGAAWCGRKNR